ncbi:hypothetical protein BD779DRAFT_1601770 [Infundibulicybe gibba]|nr:hypothetical protein BD779DRAFT_1601770 [Infundibulicybe gibba]
MIVDNGDGLVRYGQGRDENEPCAEAKAFSQALYNVDWVERFHLDRYGDDARGDPSHLTPVSCWFRYSCGVTRICIKC